MRDHKIDVFDPNKAVMFRNWTNDPFTGEWAKSPHVFQPGESRYYPEGLAHHFAKHLTDWALIKQGKDTDDQTRPELYAKCFVDVAPIVSADAESTKVEVMNQKQAEAAVDVPAEIVPPKDARIDNLAKARAAKAAKKAAEVAAQ